MMWFVKKDFVSPKTEFGILLYFETSEMNLEESQDKNLETNL